ncbi:hypothetical protein ACLOJK_036084 [Asimina triloba]
MHHTHIPKESLDVFTIGNVKEESQCHFTVLVRGIPRCPSYSDAVKNFFMNYHASSYLSHQMIYRTGKVHKLMDNAERMYKRLVCSTPSCLDPKRGLHKVRCGLCGVVAPHFKLYANELQMAEMQPELGHLLSLEEKVPYHYLGTRSLVIFCRVKNECPAAFVFFKTRYAAVVACQALHKPGGYWLPPKCHLVDILVLSSPNNDVFFYSGRVHISYSPPELTLEQTYLCQILNVYRQKYETGGQYWPIMHNTIIALGVFGTKKATVASGFTFLGIILTLLFAEYCRQRFRPLFDTYSAQKIIEMDRSDVQHGRMAEIYRHVIQSYRRNANEGYDSGSGKGESSQSMDEGLLHPTIGELSLSKIQGALTWISMLMTMQERRGSAVNMFDSAPTNKLKKRMTTGASRRKEKRKNDNKRKRSPIGMGMTPLRIVVTDDSNGDDVSRKPTTMGEAKS